MSSQPQPSTFYMGWDVGGWNCDKNSKSRDALVMLAADLKLVGSPWRGNLRTTINEAADSTEWIKRLFTLCKAVPPIRPQITLSIDTPLGFSNAFTRLLTLGDHAGEVGRSATNRIPEPSPIAKELLGALDVKLPLMLPKSTVAVDTKKKLASRRKS